MNFEYAYIFCVLGIVISVVLPILRKCIPTPKEPALRKVRLGSRFWIIEKPYFILAIFSLVAGLLTVASAGDSVKDWNWFNALLIGYAWDSTIQKIGKT